MGIRAPAGRACARAVSLLLVGAWVGAGDAAAQSSYVVTITGEGSDAVADTVKQVSELMKRAAEPAPPFEILEQRARRDRGTIEEALRALGYYDGTVRITVNSQTQPPTATIAVDPGPRYAIGAYEVTEVPGGGGPRVLIDRVAVGMAPGAPAAGAAIVDADHKVEAQYGAKGYVFAKVTERRS